MTEDHALRHILVVDDSRGDTILAERSFVKAGVERISVASSGEKALEMLHDESSALPDLMLLDLNLPRISGMQVLAKLKDNKRLKSIPVIILSSSSSAQDVNNSYGLHATGYAVKPDSLVQYRKFVEAVQAFFAVKPAEVDRFCYPADLVTWL